MRLPSNGFREFQEILETSKREGLVHLDRPRQKLNAQVRLIRYRVGKEEYSILTTLTEETFSRADLRAIYKARWGIEEFFKNLKHVGKIEQFRSISKNGMLQEIYAFLLLQTLGRFYEATLKPCKRGKTKGRPKFNHKNTLAFASMLSPLMLRKNVAKTTLDTLKASLLLGVSYTYSGRHFPRRSFKPSARWRCTKSKEQRLRIKARQALAP